ncbi:unnamed protein product [Mytilus edulis]|uniref:Uncharacterized protein n=1 Tax=Mytilus edulis TaxID=6550 RepID=A0A8S3V2J0_MYTED|nr:unnamed protein product [Mytilus edulis]
MMVTKVPSRSFGNINLTLQMTINTKQDKFILGTYLLPDGRMVFSGGIFVNGTIIVLNANGSLSFEVHLPSSSFDVTYITEGNTLAVSSGGSSAQCIYIIDMENRKVKKTISVNDRIYGIKYNGTGLIHCGHTGIRMIDPNDETIRDIVRGKILSECYVTAYGDKLYHTNLNKNTVTCYDIKGNKKWAFENKIILQAPAGISVDNDGNIYVVGRKSNSLIMISPDGKRHRQLLSAKDGLSEPWSIHFSMERNMLIVANSRGGKAFLYSVN